MKLENYLNVLEKSKLFGIHADVDFIKIFNSIDYKIVKYSKGQVVHNEDELCTCLSIILEGNIEIQKIDAMGKLLTVAEFTLGSTFGENLIFGDRKKYPMTVFSKTETIVLEIKKDSVATLCQLDPKFMFEFLNTVSNRTMVLNSKLKEVTLKTIRQKICEFLLMKYNKTKETEINIGMTKKDWADKLGVQRPSLSRELIKMKEDEIIDYYKDIIIIKNIHELE
ncbi:Crp/Fnr family transcriptional regulator [Clostridium vincentii]|uniref:Transcriptional activator FtrB n=1 Tax=Clostridium vincentii TaxID=52704 RepID=A0A2T0B998_9CLOT|nr:Crp/Fnr family transcriptional regulator [Clostridium vincentii]PRR80460.1 transcriptional activator FtrB [Clostridium vincentii]